MDEVRAGIEKVVVPPVVLDSFGYSPPLHLIVMDTSGECIVIEHVGGEVTVHENPLGIITNSPSFDWHMTNLNNYIHLSAVNREPVELEGLEIREMGQGSGLLGMPGDFTPPSRFVRAFVYSLSALPAASGDGAVRQAFHILNQFDIPAGVCRRPETGPDGSVQYEYTLWSAVTDLARRRYYIRICDDSRIRMVDLTVLDPEGPEVLVFSMAGEEEFENITSRGTALR